MTWYCQRQNLLFFGLINHREPMIPPGGILENGGFFPENAY